MDIEDYDEYLITELENENEILKNELSERMTHEEKIYFKIKYGIDIR